MKKTSLILSLLVSSAAFAGQSAFFCKENGTAPDSGYSVYISKSGSHSTVEELTSVGAKTLATLQCSKSEHRGSQPEETRSLLTCSESTLRDGSSLKNKSGYSLHLIQGESERLATATLSEMNYNNSKPIAQLTCQTGQ